MNKEKMVLFPLSVYTELPENVQRLITNKLFKGKHYSLIERLNNAVWKKPVVENEVTAKKLVALHIRMKEQLAARIPHSADILDEVVRESTTRLVNTVLVEGAADTEEEALDILLNQTEWLTPIFTKRGEKK